MISNCFFSMNTYLRERGRVVFTIKHLIRNAPNQFQRCKLICKLIIKMYFFHLYANDNQFNAKFHLPTTLSDQGDSSKNMQISHKQHTLLKSNKGKKIKNTKGRRKRLDQMTSNNQMRRVTNFKFPSLEFPLNRIGEKKARDRFQALNIKNSRRMKKGIKFEK
jgi:hypothetical protein